MKIGDIFLTKQNEWDIPTNIQFKIDDIICDDDMQYVIAYNPIYGVVDFDFDEISPITEKPMQLFKARI